MIGCAADEIVRLAVDADIDLIAMGRQGLALSQEGMGAVVSRVIERAPCPVVTVSVPEEARMLAALPAAAHRSSAEAASRGILVATDLGDLSQAAVAYARQLALDLRCPIQVLHVVAPPWTVSPGAASPTPDPLETFGLAARLRNSQEFQTQFPDQSGVEPAPLVRVGDPATEIIRCAQQLGDYAIVLGTHGRGAVGRKLLGSIACDVLARATGPAITVNPLAARRVRRSGDAPAAGGAISAGRATSAKESR
jgi:nucleotide-binding universal stress UspA family protein